MKNLHQELDDDGDGEVNESESNNVKFIFTSIGFMVEKVVKIEKILCFFVRIQCGTTIDPSYFVILPTLDRNFQA